MNKVKYDHDPTNDYSDGYNAGRRYNAKHKKSKWWLWLLLLLLGLLAWWLLKDNPSETSTTKVNPSPTVTSHFPAPSTLPAVGK